MTSMVDKLTSIEESEAAGAWNEFSLNTKAERSLLNTPERVPEVLMRGISITNWNALRSGRSANRGTKWRSISVC